MLVDALAAVAPRFGPQERKEKVALLDRLEGVALRRPRLLLRFHESLCFLQAYPDDPEVLARVERALAECAPRVGALAPSARERLHDSGIAGTSLDYPFGLPMARWLAARFPVDADVLWRRFENVDGLDEALAMLAAHAEGDAFSEGGLGWRRWLRVAKGGRPITDLRLLVELFERSPLAEETREAIFEGLGLPIAWRLAAPRASRTLAKLPTPDVFFHEGGLERRLDVPVEMARPLPAIRRVARPRSESLIEAARIAMATRARELHAFSRANADDVLLVEAGRGLEIALIGIEPRFRLPLEAYYAFLALKNGVPIGYGGGWEMFGSLEWAMNVFPSFRQGESAFLAVQVLRAYRRLFGMRTVVVDRYQIGHENDEALRSGAFYFYHRLGFRPRLPHVVQLLEAERARIAADPSYRSPRATLKRLAAGEVYLTLPGGHPEPERRLRASQVAALVTRAIAHGFAGDRAAALRRSAARVARALGAPTWRRWPADERRAFERLSLVAALVPDLARWPAADRRRLAAVLRSKGGATELAYGRLLDGHRRLQGSLEALVRA